MRKFIPGLLGFALTLGIIFFLSGQIGMMLQDAAGKHPLVIGLLCLAFVVLTQILAPLSGYAGFIVALHALGIEAALSIMYLSCIISAVVNFWLARKLAQPLVEKLAGRSDLKFIDKLAGVADRRALIASRLFGYYIADVISYFWGLTRINFAEYIFVTIVVTAVPVALQYLLFLRFDFNSQVGLIVFYGLLIGFAVVSAGAWWLYARFVGSSAIRSQPDNPACDTIER